MKPTLVRRVSDLFKADGSSNGSPLIFNHSSLKKLRHCCQNFNLFPYLLYSLGNSKSNDPNKLNLNLIIKRITEKIILLYASIYQTIRYHFYVDKIYQKTIYHSIEIKKITDRNIKLTTTIKNINSFDKFDNEKVKSNLFLMKVSIYIGVILLVAQSIGVLSLILKSKFTPGFVFLVCSLMLLGYISMKVLFHHEPHSNLKKHGKRKIE